jgi:hypothetical protein
MRDAAARGRAARGPDNGQSLHVRRCAELDVRPGQAILRASQVREMRRLRALGATTQVLTSTFGVAPGTVRDICARRSWRHV